MFDFTSYAVMLAVLLAVAIGAWGVSLARRDVSIVDSLWSLMILVCLLGYIALAGAGGSRAILLGVLATAWALRLAIYITWRNHGEGEDRRYRAMRDKRGSSFRFTSLYLVFGLQAVLAWFIAMPLAVGAAGPALLGWLDLVGALVWLVGMTFETVGDAQLARFRGNPENEGEVLNSGLWRYTRHPNYFGECVLWWGFFIIATAGGGAWTVLSPLLMTILLLRVSGVHLLEQDIGDRRPGYAQYIKRTNAFIPGPPKPESGAAAGAGGGA